MPCTTVQPPRGRRTDSAWAYVVLIFLATLASFLDLRVREVVNYRRQRTVR
jgi:hypothetical protein